MIPHVNISSDVSMWSFAAGKHFHTATTSLMGDQAALIHPQFTDELTGLEATNSHVFTPCTVLSINLFYEVGVVSNTQNVS